MTADTQEPLTEPTNERLREIITASLTIGEQHKHAIYAGEGVSPAEALRGIEAAKDAALSGIVALNRLDAARAVPEPSGLDVDTLAEAWANVMDGRRMGADHAVRISRFTTTFDDWRAIRDEYARLRAALSTSEPPAEGE